MPTNDNEKGRRSDLHWTKEKVESVDRRLDHQSVHEVAKQEGVTRQRLTQVMKQNGILPPRKREKVEKFQSTS